MFNVLSGLSQQGKVALSADTLDVLYFSALDSFYKNSMPITRNLSGAELERLADALLHRTDVDTNALRKVRAKLVTISTHTRRPLFEALWQRQQHGYEFRHDLIRLVLNPKNGQLLAYRKNWGKAPGSYIANISKDHARQTACSHIMAHFKAKQTPQATVSGPLVVCPNKEFGGLSSSASFRRLAWIVVIPKHAEYRNALEVWVDAENGGILGGEIFW